MAFGSMSDQSNSLVVPERGPLLTKCPGSQLVSDASCRSSHCVSGASPFLWPGFHSNFSVHLPLSQLSRVGERANGAWTPLIGGGGCCPTGGGVSCCPHAPKEKPF